MDVDLTDNTFEESFFESKNCCSDALETVFIKEEIDVPSVDGVCTQPDAIKEEVVDVETELDCNEALNPDLLKEENSAENQYPVTRTVTSHEEYLPIKFSPSKEHFDRASTDHHISPSQCLDENQKPLSSISPSPQILYPKPLEKSLFSLQVDDRKSLSTMGNIQTNVTQLIKTNASKKNTLRGVIKLSKATDNVYKKFSTNVNNRPTTSTDNTVASPRHETEPAIGTYQCKKCSRAFASVSTLQRHMKLNENGLCDPSEIFICNACSCSFDIKEFMSHSKLQCKIASGLSSKPKNGHPLGVSEILCDTERKPFPCRLCDFKTENEQLMIQHIKLHDKMTEGLQFVCNNCDFMCLNISAVLQHVCKLHQQQTNLRELDKLDKTPKVKIRDESLMLKRNSVSLAMLSQVGRCLKKQAPIVKGTAIPNMLGNLGGLERLHNSPSTSNKLKVFHKDFVNKTVHPARKQPSPFTSLEVTKNCWLKKKRHTDQKYDWKLFAQSKVVLQDIFKMKKLKNFEIITETPTNLTHRNEFSEPSMLAVTPSNSSMSSTTSVNPTTSTATFSNIFMFSDQNFEPSTLATTSKPMYKTTFNPSIVATTSSRTQFETTFKAPISATSAKPVLKSTFKSSISATTSLAPRIATTFKPPISTITKSEPMFETTFKPPILTTTNSEPMLKTIFKPPISAAIASEPMLETTFKTPISATTTSETILNTAFKPPIMNITSSISLSNTNSSNVFGHSEPNPKTSKGDSNPWTASMFLYTCQQCKFTTTTARSLRYHLNQCGKSSQEDPNSSPELGTTEILSRNFETINSEEGSTDKISLPSYTCTTCPFTTTTARSLRYHLTKCPNSINIFELGPTEIKARNFEASNSKGISNDKISSSSYTCKQCPFTTTTARSMRYHLTKCPNLHLKLGPTEIRPRNIEANNAHRITNKTTSMLSYRCKHCPFYATTVRRLRYHQAKCLNLPPECGRTDFKPPTFADNSFRPRYMDPCPRCKFYSPLVHIMVPHLDTCGRENLVLVKNFVCTICNYKTSKSHEIQHHMKSHNVT